MEREKEIESRKLKNGCDLVLQLYFHLPRISISIIMDQCCIKRTIDTSLITHRFNSLRDKVPFLKLFLLFWLRHPRPWINLQNGTCTFHVAVFISYIFASLFNANKVHYSVGPCGIISQSTWEYGMLSFYFYSLPFLPLLVSHMSWPMPCLCL